MRNEVDCYIREPGGAVGDGEIGGGIVRARNHAVEPSRSYLVAEFGLLEGIGSVEDSKRRFNQGLVCHRLVLPKFPPLLPLPRLHEAPYRRI